MTIGEKIKKLRTELRYSQDAFARLVGCSQNAISSYECNLKKPGLKVIKGIMKFAKANKIKINLLED